MLEGGKVVEDLVPQHVSPHLSKCRDAREEEWRCTNFGRAQSAVCADTQASDTGRLQTFNREQAVKQVFVLQSVAG